MQYSLVQKVLYWIGGGGGSAKAKVQRLLGESQEAKVAGGEWHGQGGAGQG
jgi:hypothetical protein